MLRIILRLTPFLLALAFVRPAAAIDDKDNTNPAAWRIYSAQSFGDISTRVGQGFRIVDIRVEDAAGSRFTVTYVHNSGTYGTAWWYLIGVDAGALNLFVAQNNARITSIACWDAGGTTRIAAVMEPNTGAGTRTWWWYSDIDVVTLYNLCLANNARPIDMCQYRVGASVLFAGVMILNTGADSKTWWMYSNISSATLGSLLAQNQARLYHMEEVASDSFSTIMVRDSVGPWWYWLGASAQSVLELAGQWGARVIDLSVNPGGSYNVIFLGQGDAAGWRVGNLMRAASDGLVGVYLKRVNGPVLAYFNGDRVFEPASTIKTLVHFEAMDQVRQGNAQLTDNLTVFTASNGSCPQTSNPITESLSRVLQLMMEASDNNRTMAAVDRFGAASINSTATALGMPGTSLNHRLGCGGPIPNQLSLADLGRLHEAVANGRLGAQRATFYQLMLEFPNNYAGGRLNAVIDQEGAGLGLSAQQIADFKARCRMAFKGGSYTFLAPTREFRSWGAWIALPFWRLTGGVPTIVEEEYVTGSFVDSGSVGANADTAFNLGASEVLRDEVRAALATWRDRVVGFFATYGVGCAGSAGVPAMVGTSAQPNNEPMIGQPIDWQLIRARASSPGVLLWGVSRDLYMGLPLPLDLTYLGMSGCTLNVSVDTTIPLVTSASGRATVTFTLPNNPSLLGSSSFVQCAVLDVNANALGVVQSNALQTAAGGLR